MRTADRRTHLAVLALALGLAAPAAAQVTVTSVTVTNEFNAPLPGVQVIALTYGNNGPDPANSQFSTTDVNGSAVFSLANNRTFQIVASSQGFLPSLQQQFNNPSQLYVYTSGQSQAFGPIVLSSSSASGLGVVNFNFINASPNVLLFGWLNSNGGQPINYGLVLTNGSGAGTLTIVDVPVISQGSVPGPVPANTYNIGLCDPSQNLCANSNVNVVLSTSAPTANLNGNFQQQAIPPPVVNENQNSGSSGPALQGAILSALSSTVPVSNTQYFFNSNQGGVYGNTDNNGNFQLFNLTAGTTYYGQFSGGCAFTQNGQSTGHCFNPWQSPALNNPNGPQFGVAPSTNDFIYNGPNANVTGYLGASESVLKVFLSEIPPSNGLIPVRVQTTSGAGIPMTNSGMNINADYYAWDTTPGDATCMTDSNGSGEYVQNPGFANFNLSGSATGYVQFTGLPSGNYDVGAFLPFGGQQVNFNGFGNGGVQNILNGNSIPCNSGYYRVSVDTNAPVITPGAPSLEVFNSSGTRMSYDMNGNLVSTNTAGSVAISSLVITVNLNQNMSGIVQGTLSFPSVTDLTNNPISITLYPQCNGNGCNGGGGNFVSVASSGSSTYNYQMLVASGTVYYMNVQSGMWAQVQNNNSNGGQINLQTSTSAVQNFQFAQGGSIAGKVYLPGGGVFIPSNGVYANVNANGQNVPSGGGTQVNSDGTYQVPSLLPGTYQLNFNVGSSTGASSFGLPIPAPTVVVYAGKTTSFDIHLVNSLLVGPAITISSTSDSTVVISTQGGGSNPLFDLSAIELPAGTSFTPQLIRNLMINSNLLPGSQYAFSPPTSTSAVNSICGSSFPGGFCAQQPNLPANATYDFYALRSGSLGSAGSPYYEFFTIVSSTKNVIVNSNNANGLVWSNQSFPPGLSSGVVVNLTPTTNQSGRGNATLQGNVTAANFFRQSDYIACAGNVNNFINFLVTVTAYDSTGKLIGGGVVTPSPTWIGQHASGGQNGPGGDMLTSFSVSYSSFVSVLNTGNPFGYQILDMPPNECMTLVFQTPNYPSYQTNACTGVNGSTTTVNVNLDSAVGIGATVMGVVVSTGNVPVSGAVIALSGQGIAPITTTTGDNGAFSFPGLGPGLVKVKASGAGFALAQAEVELSGSKVFTNNFTLIAGPGSMTGTVYAHKIPFVQVQSGALIYAYDDTANGLNPGSSIPLYKTTSGSDGTYTLSGLIPNHFYKVFLDVPSEYVLDITTPATNGVVTGVDFTLLQKPLDIQVFVVHEAPFFEVHILNPSDFSTGAGWIGPAPFVSTATMMQVAGSGGQSQQQPDGSIIIDIPDSTISSTTTYDIHIWAISNTNVTVTKDVLFGFSVPAGAAQSIDAALIGDDSDDGTGHSLNEALLDKSGQDPSSVSFPAGAALPTSQSAVPNVTFSAHSPGDPTISGITGTVSSSAFVGSVYQLNMSSVSLNPDMGIDITLAYNQSSATAAGGNILLSQFNQTNNTWQQVPGVATLNPLKGTVTVRLKSLASVLKVHRLAAQLESQSDIASLGPLYSHFDGQKYVLHPLAAGGTNTIGTFAVLNAAALQSATYGGASFSVFNFPNPFNLQSKTVATSIGGSITTNGTVIHFELPAGDNGDVKIRIYTISGELVRSLDQGNLVGGNHYYVTWDGTNSSGHQVANGIYYGILQGAGISAKNGTFKMAVIK